MIELIAARGNTSLESAMALTKELRLDIQHLGQRLAKAAATSEEYRIGSARNKAALRAENENEMQLIVHDMKKLLTRLEDAIPLINLALQTSGARLSTQLPTTVSPSRLLQASAMLATGDSQYMKSPQHAAQIGPTFTLSVYMLFAGHNRPETEEDIRHTTWKEVIHKARVKLRRVPLDLVLSTGSGSDAMPSSDIRSLGKIPDLQDSQTQVRAEARGDEYAYQMMVLEDFDDDRHHDFDDDENKPGPFDDVKLAGIREMIPVHEISKIFYADTSKVLNIGMDAESNHPVLLLRRDVQAVPPRRMYERDSIEAPDELPRTNQDDGRPKTEDEKKYVEHDHTDRKRDPWRLPPSLDPEWIALEVYTEAEPSDTESALDEEGEQDFRTPNEEPESSQLAMPLSELHINSPQSIDNTQMTLHEGPSRQQLEQVWVPHVKTSLSLLELLLRLTSLQQFQQQSHLSITDELLNFFLEESASTGAGGDEEHRQAMRADARRRVGWDPYDESPVKRRGEDYQYRPYSESSRIQQNYGNGYYGSVTSPSQRGSPFPPSSATRPPPQHYPIGSLSPATDGNHYSPSRGVSAQTRSITGTPEATMSHQNPFSSTDHRKNITISNRPEWLKHQGSGPSPGSPLRPITTQSDEGIGTSPGSMVQDEHK